MKQNKRSEYIKKIKLILTKPNEFFEKLKEENLNNAFLYFAILSLISIILGTITGFFTQQYVKELLIKIFNFKILKTELNFTFLLFFNFLVYLQRLALSFLYAGLLHVWILVFGGKANFNKTYQLYVYSKTPSLIFGWIPFVGYIVWIYDLVLLIIGTQKIHKISRTKAILMYVIPILILIMLYITLIAFFIVFLESAKPLLFNHTKII